MSSGNWEAECYKKWMTEFSDRISNEYKSVMKNANNPTICNANTLDHLKDEIMRKNNISKKIDELFNSYKLSNKTNEAKKSLEYNLKGVFDNEDSLGFGAEEECDQLPTAIAFANVCEKIKTLNLTGKDTMEAKRRGGKKKKDGGDDAVSKKEGGKKGSKDSATKGASKKDGEKKVNKKEGADGEVKKKKEKKNITANKNNTLFLQKLYNFTGGEGEIKLKKSGNGEIIMEKSGMEIFKSLPANIAENQDATTSTN